MNHTMNNPHAFQQEATETSIPRDPGIICTFKGHGGVRCPHAALRPGGFCFWHDPHVDKTGPHVKAELEALVRDDRSLEGFNLRGADLRSIQLTHRNPEKSVDLRNADLSRANLQGAHLFNIDLRGSTLLKADVRGANLNFAKVEGANLLGADLRDTRLERLEWGKRLMQEYAARKMQHEGRPIEAMRLYDEAEETYRAVTLALQERGHSNLAGHFYLKQKIMSRMQMKVGSREWFWSKLVDIVCGYGERPDRVIAFTLWVMLVCGLVYFAVGIQGQNGILGIDFGASLVDNLYELLSCLYFSVVTFTTVGYGEILPIRWLRALAAGEAFVGAFSISLFVVVFVKRMTR